MGFINVENHAAFQSSGLVIQLKGYDSITCRKRRSRGTGKNRKTRWVNYKRKTEFLSLEYMVMPMVDPNVPPGMFSYPFTLQLPADLPGSMSMAPDSSERPKLSIRYALLAQFIPLYQQDWADEGKRISKFRGQQACYLWKPLPTVWPVGQLQEFHKDVSYFCVINKGTCNFSIQTDKNMYVPGEIINFKVLIDNSKCSRPVINMSIGLGRKYSGKA